MPIEHRQPTILILLFHPNLERSKVNAAMAQSAASLPYTSITDMSALYPKGIQMERDGAREAARLLDADGIVLQFPMQWYSTPVLMKQWQDTVLTRMGYLHQDTEGVGLAGKPIMIAATMGAEEATYRPEGRNRFSVMELLAPLRASANRFAMDWQEPFLVYGADLLDYDGLSEAGREYRRALSSFSARTQRADRIQQRVYLAHAGDEVDTSERGPRSEALDRPPMASGAGHAPSAPSEIQT
ncbi:NAD(P)H-dependent oxidoreductase [Qipengyuania qiaonensis]|uniref:NAD(P)H-dependent oxidoreductase n=1 Tax=Qipengyuania qiaonensis TaxID=2867240 RepID=A0ABS7J7P5_9SPHN|nr:NAD(P)H-dependent oxidoreductase [Qipengyuania qiaonensis]MBX7483332.1 NAD(P)H-dependent oxidoreductase [Qipengyuania qiaonensis]